MIFPRAYVPSITLLRALARPQPIRCSIARASPVHVRGKRHRAVDVGKPDRTAPTKETVSDALLSDLQNQLSNWEEHPAPLTDHELETLKFPEISYWEQDMEKGGPRRLIERIVTPEDRRRENDTYRDILESVTNPQYDGADLNKRLLDSLIRDPNFADLAGELMNMMGDIKSKEELAELDAQAAEEAKVESQQYAVSMRLEINKALQDLINDPNFAAAKSELQEVVDKIPDLDDSDNPESPEFDAIMDRAMDKINGNPAMARRLQELLQAEDEDISDKELEELEKEEEEGMLQENDNDDDDRDLKSIDDLKDADAFLLQMRDVLRDLGGDPELEAELMDAMEEAPEESKDAESKPEIDHMDLAEEIKRFAETQSENSGASVDDEDDVPAELQAKVDQIMQDPRLMERLMYIRELIAERQKTDLTAMTHETAPDPYELEESRTATLQERMRVAKSDPEHAAALARLHVSLRRPFNISPSLKAFNQAIEFAYIGANDDVRRVLWRTYQKARLLPTFLQNMSDDAWDILYYSQAVTWSSNQNRQSHLQTILKDLKSVGRDGPPTHPSTLGHVEA
ncbi:hypothetical protein ACN47E_001070 [Coniothyrium glycines]